LYRLEMNLMEMGDMAYMGNLNRLVNTLGTITGIDEDGIKIKETSFDRLFEMLESNTDIGTSPTMKSLQSDIFGKMNQKIRTMASTDKISLDMLPSNIRDSLISKDGESYLISISPTQNPWEGAYRDIFTDQMESVTDKGTGMILVGDQMNLMAQEDGRRASIFALIAVFLILLADFKNIKLAVITMLPLLSSFLTLFGIMALTGIKFDFINIIVVPLLIGIGIDNAVHINHRYLREGKGKMDFVIARTGTALLMTTLTTVFGFASFIPSIMRAMRSTGIVLSLAMAIAFLFSVLFHPAVLIIVTEKLGLNINPWSKK
ncbi:MAG: MMPL family transporter, partial [Spirochaetales bacterium]|nr:MMPL family transporter [Spirochaetales bacterium]